MSFDWGSQAMEDYNNNKTNASELLSRKVIKKNEKLIEL